MQSKTRLERSKKREIIFSLVSILLSSLLCLGVAEYALRWYQQSVNNSSSGDPGLLSYDSQFGWKLTPNWQGRHTHHDFDVQYTINKYGFRGDFPPELQTKKKKRMAIVGDSFSFGLGVNDQDTFVHLLNLDNPDTEFLNLSVPGYSTDQQLLLLKRMSALIQADHYLLIVYLGNDLLDNMLDYPLQVEQAKPYFVIDNTGDLQLKNVPVPNLQKPAALRSRTLSSEIFGDSLMKYESKSYLRKSRLWRRIFPAESAIPNEQVIKILNARLKQHKILMSALIDETNKHIKNQGSSFEIAMLPGSSFIKLPESYASLFQDYVRVYLTELAIQKSIPVIDVAGEMRAQSPHQIENWYHAYEGHLNSKGHRLLAQILKKTSVK
ncbi:MAG: hypothetical protein GKR93_07960 [Gammaproteobacteria bacterium]|nr:hypothetical protein [Gammaproteobacteria bacterium]